MRIFIALFLVCLIGLPALNAHADDSKDQLYNQCMRYQKDESFCTCAMGKPYDELASTPSYTASTASLEWHLKNLEKRYSDAYDLEMTKGGLRPSQIERICKVVDEYHIFLDQIGMPYNKTGVKKPNKKMLRGSAGLSTEQKQALTLKRRELNKKIHDLNHEYQRAGALGSFSTLSNGACVLEDQVRETKEELRKSNGVVTLAPVIGIRSLLAKSEEMCGG